MCVCVREGNNCPQDHTPRAAAAPRARVTAPRGPSCRRRRHRRTARPGTAGSRKRAPPCPAPSTRRMCTADERSSGSNEQLGASTSTPAAASASRSHLPRPFRRRKKNAMNVGGVRATGCGEGGGGFVARRGAPCYAQRRLVDLGHHGGDGHLILRQQLEHRGNVAGGGGGTRERETERESARETSHKARRASRSMSVPSSIAPDSYM